MLDYRLEKAAISHSTEQSARRIDRGLNREKQKLTERLNVRPARASDAEFLTAVYAMTRRGELAPLGWSDRQIEFFCRMQFDLQTQAYRMQFPGAENYVVELDEKAIGRLLVDRGEQEIRLVDVAFLPEFRGLGAGTAIVENVQREAATADKPLGLRVLATNRAAIRFYERLGFVAEESNQTHLSMCWRKETPTSENSRKKNEGKIEDKNGR